MALRRECEMALTLKGAEYILWGSSSLSSTVTMEGDLPSSGGDQRVHTAATRAEASPSPPLLLLLKETPKSFFDSILCLNTWNTEGRMLKTFFLESYCLITDI